MARSSADEAIQTTLGPQTIRAPQATTYNGIHRIDHGNVKDTWVRLLDMERLAPRKGVGVVYRTYMNLRLLLGKWRNGDGVELTAAMVLFFGTFAVLYWCPSSITTQW